MLYGKCYPASDLYALGATLIALLTGRHPNKLMDPENQTWNWRQYAKVSDGTAQILDRTVFAFPGVPKKPRNPVSLRLKP